MSPNSPQPSAVNQDVSRRYSETLDGYKVRLQQSHSFPLNVYCKEVGVSYHGMKNRMLPRGYRVRSLQAEASGKDATKKSGESSEDSFIQIKPIPQSRQALRWDLHGVSITFTDGVNLTLQECSTESVISLLTIYRNRKNGGRSDVQP